MYDPEHLPTLPPNFSNTVSKEQSLYFSQHLSHPTRRLPSVLAPAKPLLHNYTPSHNSPSTPAILHCSAHPSALSKHNTPPPTSRTAKTRNTKILIGNNN